MNKIIDNQDRGVLEEGRNYQMGFAFVKKIGKDTFETVQPVSPCKDYMNDVVYSEATGKDMYAYGLAYSKQSLWADDEEKIYFIIRICADNHSTLSYKDFEKDKERLAANFKKLQRFMQFFDKVLKAKNKTLISKTNLKDTFLVRMDRIWKESTYMISLYTLLMRVGQFWDGEKDIMEYIEKFNAFPADVYLLNPVKPKIKRIIEGHRILSNLQTIPTFKVHNEGIVAYKEAVV